jgi:RecA-family ATPase
MDKLAPKLIRRAQKKNYIAIVIDPIYKVITGDENSADQMAHFCNQFDRVCFELGAAVIYCHHHSKGTQGQKRSMDRASGSGVFARDPDALLDLIELDLNENLIKQEENKALCSVCIDHLDRFSTIWEDKVSQSDMHSSRTLLEACDKYVSCTHEEQQAFLSALDKAKKRLEMRTAWRIDATLREYPKFAPVNIWFDYPTHSVDTDGLLQDADADGDAPPWQRSNKKKRSPEEIKEDNKKERQQCLETAYEALSIDDVITINSLMEYTGKKRNTIKNYIDEHSEFTRDKDGVVTRGCQTVKL